jgi:hypothetical protein
VGTDGALVVADDYRWGAILAADGVLGDMEDLLSHDRTDQQSRPRG